MPQRDEAGLKEKDGGNGCVLYFSNLTRWLVEVPIPPK
jgi:hypothetical protein